jgi:8-oxo-dGTP pyrophosphatase MutT (NUDIX family)
MKSEHRRAARLVVVDAQNRVLLFQYARPTGERFWATPGGRLEHGETFEEGAAREAAEELGLKDARLERLCDRAVDFRWDDRTIHQHERLFLVHDEAREFEAEVLQVHRREGILEQRWWSLAELERTRDLIFPEDLAAMLKGIAGTGTRESE